MLVSFQAALAEVKSRFEVVSVISKYLPLKKSGAGYIAVCPFHNDRSPSLNISPTKGIYKCFACGASGDFLKFLTEYKKQSFSEVVHDLARELDIEIMASSSRENSPEESLALALHQSAAEFYGAQLLLSDHKSVRVYLDRRQIRAETRELFALGYSPARQCALYEHIRGLPEYSSEKVSDERLVESGLFIASEKGIIDRFRGRLMFPIRNPDGQVIAFGGRALSDSQQPKYLNSPESPIYSKGRHLYGYDLARLNSRQARKILLLEGYFDVIQAHQEGINFAVGSLGTALTLDQAKLLYQSNLAHQIVLAFDSDEAGMRALESSLNVFQTQNLAHLAQLKALILEEHKDIDEYICAKGSDSLLRLIDEAPGAYQVWLKQKTKDLAPEDGEARKEVLQNIALGLGTLSDPLLRELLAEETARLLSFSKSTVLQTLQRYQVRLRDNRSTADDIRSQRSFMTNRSSPRKQSPTSDAAKTLIALLFLTVNPELLEKIEKADLPNPKLDQLRAEILILDPMERYRILRDESSISAWQELIEIARWNEENNLIEILEECLEKLRTSPKFRRRRRLNKARGN
ncbi:MAG: DNA primase [Candidatus Caenarcaniphilales bacterium]|nr:DNA primase [Candidatus Caenarcaniphilales bacterium]